MAGRTPASPCGAEGFSLKVMGVRPGSVKEEEPVTSVANGAEDKETGAG